MPDIWWPTRSRPNWRRVKELSVISPTRMLDEFHLKIVTSIGSGARFRGQAPAPSAKESRFGAGLRFALFQRQVRRSSHRRCDPVHEFCTKTMQDRPDTSKSAGVEFSVYLISTRTGKAIWGARFVGSQSVSMANVFSAQSRWLDKQDYSREAIKKVLKDFQDMAESK